MRSHSCTLIRPRANGVASCPVPCQATDRSFPRFWSTKRCVLFEDETSRMRCGNAPRWSCFCTTIPRCPMRLRARKSNSTPMPFAIGASVGPGEISSCTTPPALADRPLFPPLDRAVVKAVACEAVHQTGLPLSRLSTTDLAQRVTTSLGKPISPATVWRILDADAIKPWRYKYWIFPRDPQFADQAGPILDLYGGLWEGRPLRRRDCIISADEKTSLQARIRGHATLPPGPGRVARVEHEYKRGGALQYLAAWDVQRGIVMGRCEATTGIEPFGRLVAQVMERKPYRSAPRVFWIVDNGSSHRGEAARQRLSRVFSNLILVHTPVHASWLNQVELYFSIIQRKVLTPNDFASLAEIEQRLHLYEELSNRQPRPFAWTFTRGKLIDLLHRLEQKQGADQQRLIHDVRTPGKEKAAA
jgi:DDE superfamily endonuclease